MWIERQIDLPESLVAAARALADEVDRNPDRSPVWGRYLDCLRQLQEPVQVAAAWSAEYRRVMESIFLGRADEAWRQSQYEAAVERGDLDPEDWLKVVPVSCVRGRHRWRQFANGVAVCRYCDTSQEELVS